MGIRRLAAACALVLLAVPAAAQPAQALDTSVTQELRLSDGSVLYGTVVSEEPDAILFRTVAGVEVRVARRDIVSLRQPRGHVVAGEFIPSDPNATRLLFAPTGRSLERGTGYVGSYQVIMPFVQVGVTNRISIGGGTPLIFGFDEGHRPFWVTPKVQVINRPRLQAAAGVLHITVPSEFSLGIAYGVVTTGSAEASMTVGLGAGYARGDDESAATAIFMIGGDRRLRRGLKVVTENYVWQGGDGIVSAALRFYGERLSADLGVFVPIGAGDLFALPIVNFVWAF
jgi:hypothetical protein